MLNGQKLQGPPTAAEINSVLRQRGIEDKYDFIFYCMCFSNVLTLRHATASHLAYVSVYTVRHNYQTP